MYFGGMIKLVLGIAIMTVMLGTPSLSAQNSQPSGRGMSSITIKGKKIFIDYGRPSMQGRDMLAMAPGGYVWRMGKDDDTVFSTDIDLMFGDISVAKGSYTAETKHGKADSWSLILSSDGKKIEIPFSYNKSGQDHVEVFTNEMKNSGNKGTLTALWGSHRLTAAFKVK